MTPQSPRRVRQRIARQRWIVAAAALFAAACAVDGITTGGVATPADDLLAAIVLDQHAITVSTAAPWNATRLRTVAISASGDTLDAGAVAYSLSDSQRVAIDASGQVTGLAAGDGIQVIATLHLGNVTRKDTAIISVVDNATPPAPAALTIAPAGGSTTIPTRDFFWFFGNDQLLANVADSSGGPIDGAPVYYTSSDATTVPVDHLTGAIAGVRPGTATIRATATVFGVVLRDSVTITVGDPQLGVVGVASSQPTGSAQPILSFAPPELTIGVGGTVLFLQTSFVMPIDVVFDDSTAVAESPILPGGGGNIPAWVADTTSYAGPFRARAFVNPGTYTYHSTLYNTNGRIIVR